MVNFAFCGAIVILNSELKHKFTDMKWPDIAIGNQSQIHEIAETRVVMNCQKQWLYCCVKQGEVKYLLNPKQRDHLELVLKYIEDADLRQWSLPNIKAFNLALGEWRSMLNCMTNPHMYEQVQ